MALGAMVVVVARWGARCGAAQPIHVLSYLRWVAHALMGGEVCPGSLI